MSNKYTEFFVVARNNEDPDMPKEVIDRYFLKRDAEDPNEHFDKAVRRQRWLKFNEGWQDVRLYEGRQMKLTKVGDDWTFVSREGEE